jgi:hypothetical protein
MGFEGGHERRSDRAFDRRLTVVPRLVLKALLAGAETPASDEAAKTAQAIAAFEHLAQRLEAIAAERAVRTWWRRLLRRAG